MMKLIISLFGVLLMCSHGAQAQQLTQYNAAKVQRAIQLQQKEQLPEAIRVLAELSPSQAYDKAYIQRMLGVFHWQNGSNQSALKHLTAAVNSQQLQDEQAWVTQRMLADLLLTEQRFKEALPHYYHLTATLPEKQKIGDLWFRIAQTHYQVAEWDKVLSALKKHQKVETSNKKEDKRQVLILMLGAQLQGKYWKSAIPTLDALIELEPEQARWWQQLANIQLRLNQSNNALDTLVLAQRQGIALSESELNIVAQLYAQRGIPEKAAQVMGLLPDYESDKTILATQATYWQAAKEWDKAIETWKKAARIDAQYYWHVAQLQVQEGYYQQALNSVDKVKNYNKTDDIALVKTRAYYKLGKIELALVSAKQANDFTPSNEAKGWIQYLSQMRKMKS